MATTAAPSTKSDPASLDYFTRNLSLDFYEKDASSHQRRVWAAGQAYHRQQACVHNQILHAITTLKLAYERQKRAFRVGIVLPDLIPATGEHLLHVLLEKLIGGGSGNSSGQQTPSVLALGDVQVLCRRPVLLKQTWPDQFRDIAVGHAFKYNDLALIILIASASSTLLAQELVREKLDGSGGGKDRGCVYFSTAPGITQKRIAALLHTDKTNILQPDWNCQSEKMDP
ncbi:hypothetical protein HDU86_006910 [Geranomyces michiganensis]|nr:hypothetical protein HDU86_006910 [Geranomyces michiganensis]